MTVPVVQAVSARIFSALRGFTVSQRDASVGAVSVQTTTREFHALAPCSDLSVVQAKLSKKETKTMHAELHAFFGKPDSNSVAFNSLRKCGTVEHTMPALLRKVVNAGHYVLITHLAGTRIFAKQDGKLFHAGCRHVRYTLSNHRDHSISNQTFASGTL